MLEQQTSRMQSKQAKDNLLIKLMSMKDLYAWRVLKAWRHGSRFAEHSSSLFHKYRTLTVFDLHKYHLGVLMYKFTIYLKLYTRYSIKIRTFTLMTQGQLLTFISIKLERLFIYQLSEIKDLFYGTNSNQCLPLNHLFTLRSI